MRGWLCLLMCAMAQATAAPTAAPTTLAPTAARNFALPRLPISKAGAKYPDCRAEIIFVLDVSGSVNKLDQQTMMRFVVQFMIAVEQNVKQVKFGIVIFGITAGNGANKYFNTTEIGMGSIFLNGPFGNGLDPASELALRLDSLRYNCTECAMINASWSQLEYLYYLTYNGANTPTWDGLNISRNEYDRNGDPTIPGRFIVLITDGVPNDGNPNCFNVNDNATCGPSLAKTERAVGLARNGTLLLTVGMNLQNQTQPLMIKWASEPKKILAVPSTDYSKLGELIPKLLSVLCPAGAGLDCLVEGATTVDVVGDANNQFLETTSLACRFYRDDEDPALGHYVRATFINTTLISCPLPAEGLFAGSWVLEYTQDGRGFYPGAKFKFGTVCRPELLVIWWPFCALALLPLAFCRPAKAAPVTTQKVTRGVARPAPAATEEYEEYEEVEEIVAPPEPVNKWKVAPTAYIGFGRARMSVDWAGVAPESAPHEGVRKKVVKKVVTDHAPVPTAGPAAIPTPAQEEAPPTETVTHQRPQTVEEPDWVNSFMDRVASIFCCCCVNKKR